MTFRYVLLASAVSLLALPAAAHMEGGKMSGKPGMGAMMMQEVDANKDGVIDKSEFTTHHGSKFSDADANKDGVVSKEEMIKHWDSERERHRRMMQDQAFSRFDGNGDGKISKEEFSAAGDKAFMMMDRNKDGKLSSDDRRMKSGYGPGSGMMPPPDMPDDE